MNIGLFDMDGSLADYEGQLTKDMLPLLHPEDKKRFLELGMWQADEQEPFKGIIRLIKKQPCWWRNLPVLENGMLIYNLATKIGFKNEILTKGPRRYSRAWKEKIEWCQAHLGDDIDVHISANKSRVYGKFLYDDYPDYMDPWLKTRPRGLGIMPVNGTNKNYFHPRCIKWDGTNLDEVREALEACYKRDNCRKSSTLHQTQT